MYVSDATLSPPNPISVFVQKRLFSISASKSTYDDVRVLDFGKIIEQSTFAPRMAQRVVDELDRVAKWSDSAMKDLKVDCNVGAAEVIELQAKIKASKEKDILDSLPPLIGADFTLEAFVPLSEAERKAAAAAAPAKK